MPFSSTHNFGRPDAKRGEGGLLRHVGRWMTGRHAGSSAVPRYARLPAAVGAFGKHPAWDDFMPDLGLGHAALSAFKWILFDNGIAAHVEHGTWESWPPEDATGDFDLAMLYRPPWPGDGGDDAEPQGWIAARVAPSRDGRDRTRYPLTLCAFAPPVPAAGPEAGAGWACGRVLPALDHVLARLATTTTTTTPEAAAGAVEAASVRLADVSAGEQVQLARSGRTMRGEAALAALDELLGDVPDPTDDSGQTRRPALLSVLHELDARLRGFGRAAARQTAPSQTSAHVRLPAASPDACTSLRLWAWFLLAALRTDVPLLLSTPTPTPTADLPADDGFEAGGHVDLVLGRPDPSTMMWLRATDARIAPITRVPYRFDDGFVARATARLSAAR